MKNDAVLQKRAPLAATNSPTGTEHRAVAAASVDGPVPANHRTVDDSALSATLKSLYERYANELRAYLGKLLGTGPPDPDDVLQQAFQKVAEARNLDDINSPKAFLWRTAQNIVTSEYRSASVRDRHAESVKDVFYREKGDGFDPERVLIARRELATVFGVLETMNEKRRDVLLMSRVDGLSLAEIGRRLGLARSTVSKRLSLAMMELDAAVNDESDR